MSRDPRYWHSRGYVPHFDIEACTQFITFRLADSMPQEVLAKWRAELEAAEITDADLRKRIETYLDQNYGSCALKITEIADTVKETLVKWNGKKYRLIAWVIMGNHVHILITPLPGHSVSEIMHSIKSFTAHAANGILGRKGHFWAKEYFDRYIRDARHFAATIRYIEENPVKAKLCGDPTEWYYSSAFGREAN